MILLAVETSTLMASVAVVDENTVLSASSVRVGSVYAEQLPVMIDQVLSDAALPVDRVDGFAISIGPGSYTGLRVGLSVVKGLAFAAGKPVVAVPTLDALAASVPFCGFPVCTMLDARRNEVYAAQYRTTHGTPERLTPFQVAALIPLLETMTHPTVFLGTGATVYRRQIVETLGASARFLPEEMAFPHAVPVAILGLQALQRGEVASLYDLEPLYLRRLEFVMKKTGSEQ